MTSSSNDSSGAILLLWLFAAVAAYVWWNYYPSTEIFMQVQCKGDLDDTHHCGDGDVEAGNLIKIVANPYAQKVLFREFFVYPNVYVDEKYLAKCDVADDRNWRCDGESNFIPRVVSEADGILNIRGATPTQMFYANSSISGWKILLYNLGFNLRDLDRQEWWRPFFGRKKG